MARNSLSEMEIDLTKELACLMRLSVSDKWFIGKSFIDELSDSIIKSDVQKIRSLCKAHDNSVWYCSESWYAAYKKNVLSIFDAIDKKLSAICSIPTLIEWLEIEYEHYGWGDMTIEALKNLQKNGIEYFNPDAHPYRYAELGMPYIEHWCSLELQKNNCPFIAENAVEYFFTLVDFVRNIQSRKVSNELYCYISHDKGLRVVDKSTDVDIYLR
ncbi:hypothetical protein CJL28_23275 [Salmonella enterica]|nr:hypothetical protein [Salmonella enterica]